MSEIVSPENFDFTMISKLKILKKRKGNPGTKAKVKYLDIVTAFDIETSRIKEIEQSIMYVWQWQFGELYTVVGRTWDELATFIERLEESIKDGSIVIYVHNLSYEFQFLQNIIQWKRDDVFAVKQRKVLKACTGKLEFRCSYMHSNASLKVYLDKYDVKHKKLDGEEFDYSIVRYPWTQLSQKELEYCQNDVLGLVEALTTEMDLDGDNLYTIPLTSTGYVRREVKRAMRDVPMNFVKKQLPTYDIYTALRDAFRGGNTHANRYYTGAILNGVKSADRVSSYPDVQCNCKFPISKFFHSGNITENELNLLINKREKAVLIIMAVTNIRLRVETWGAPYLANAKCRHVIDGSLDNGRILSADFLETTVTDVDYKIICDEYVWDDIEIVDSWHARYGKLPEPLIKTTIGFFEGKTTLKGVPGEEIQYSKKKNLLNAIYGMSAQDPGKQSSFFENGEWIDGDTSIEEILDGNNKRAIQPYQWGVWITAWARYRLEQGIKLADDNFVYCDTDSVKYIGDVDWGQFNAARIEDSKQSGAFATDIKGKTHYMGPYEYDGDYEEFATMGAKKYCTREKGGHLQATISGVAKDVWGKDPETGASKLIRKGGGAELEDAGGISQFKSGFIFKEAGGTESVYNDAWYGDYQVAGHTLNIGPNLTIRPSTYTLGLAEDYEQLIASFFRK